MFAYLHGKIAFQSPTDIYLDVNGVGYHLNISLNTYSQVEGKSEAKLFTYLHVREDILSLYGFSEEAEKRAFLLLISVSGIGPNTARVVLSSMTTKEVNSAILQENVAAFNKVKGIGPKTAKRLILDLKDKVAKLDLEGVESTVILDSSNKEEAISALLALGFNKQQIGKRIDAILAENPENDKVEYLIKEVLKQMS